MNAVKHKSETPWMNIAAFASDGRICVSFYQPNGFGSETSSVSTQAWLQRIEAETLLAALTKALDTMPRIAEASDLGLAA